MWLRSVAVGAVAAVSTLALGVAPASASTTYTCSMTTATPCAAPLTGTFNGTVNTSNPSVNGYGFDLNGTDVPGTVQVSNITQVQLAFPIDFSIQVMGVKVPSSKVGDYDVVRGTPQGANWKLEVMAKNNRTTAVAACAFKGTKTKKLLFGGPDLSTFTSWVTLRCVNTGSQIQLWVNGVEQATANVATGPVSNPGPLLIGAKDTTGGDQFSGWAKNFSLTVG